MTMASSSSSWARGGMGVGVAIVIVGIAFYISANTWIRPLRAAATLPWPPSAQMLTMARWPLGHRGEFLDRLADDARAGGAERMAERRAAAVGVHALAREGAEIARHPGAVAQEGRILQRLQVEGDLRREGFVDLPEMDVVVARDRGARAGAGWRRPAPSAGPRRGSRRRRSPSRPVSRAACWPADASRPFVEATQMAAAPSVSGEELPAVRRALAAGAVERRAAARASFSSDVSLRGMVSRVTSPTGITRSSKKPRSQAATALRWLASAISSCSSRADLPFLGGDLGVLAHAHAGGAVADRRDEELHVAQMQVRQMVELLAERPRLLELAQPVGEALAEADLDAAQTVDAADQREVACCRRRSCRRPRSRPSCWSSRP